MTVPASSGGPAPSRSAVNDRELRAVSGYPLFALGLGLLGLAVWFGLGRSNLLAGVFAVAGVFVLAGLVILQPNQSLVCLLFGSYVGTEHRPGFWWVFPLYTKKKISRRLNTLECGPLKVNDAVGNPIDIGAAIVWRVEDAARAVLEVEDYKQYVGIQSETALRRTASTHPYDYVEVDEMERLGAGPKPREISHVTLKDGGDEIVESLLAEIRIRMRPIGIAVDEARITHLAYSAEIAGAMLRKQAASAVVAARRMVVKGAVSIVADALREIEDRKLGGGPLDPERRAAMISNLLVVLVGDREATPVINTGTLHA